MTGLEKIVQQIQDDAQQAAQAFAVTAADRHGIFQKSRGKALHFFRQIIRVIKKEFRPHILVEPGNACHIMETACRKTLVPLCRRRFHIRAGEHVRQL